MHNQSLRRIERLNYILGGVMVAAAPFFLGKEEALGVLVGVLLGAVNFSVLRRIVERWLTNASKGNHNSGFFLIPKMMLLMGAVFAALFFLPISALFLAAGFSIFVISIAIETVRVILYPPEVPNGDDANVG
jgi:hypothetical protein